MRRIIVVVLVLLMSTLQSTYSQGKNETKDSLTTKEPFISKDNLFYSNSDFSWKPYDFNDKSKIRFGSISLFDITMFSNQNNLFQFDLMTFRTKYFNVTALTELCEAKSIIHFFDEKFDNIYHMEYALSFGLRYPIICSEKHRLTINSNLYWFDKPSDLYEGFILHPFLDSQLRYEYKYGIAAIGGYRLQLYDSKNISNPTYSFLYKNNLNGLYLGLSIGLTYNENTNKGITFWGKTKAENSINAYQTFLNNYPDTRYANEAKSRLKILEKEVYRKALNGNIKECEYYITKFPNGNYIEDIIERYEQLYYNKAMQGNINDCEFYLFKFENGKYTEEISNRTENLYYSNAMNGKIQDCKRYLENYKTEKYKNHIDEISEKMYFNKAIDGTINDCDSYLSRFENGKYKNQVLKRKINIYDAIKEDSIYKKAIKRNLNECNKYIDEYPSGKYYSEIQKIIKEINEENILYKSIIAKNKIQEMKEYIEKYPNGKYIQYISNKIEPILFKKALKEDWYTEYENYVRYCPNGLNILKVKQRLDYLMSHEADIDVKYPSVIYGGPNLIYKWYVTFSEKSGTMSYNVSGSGWYYDEEGKNWGLSANFGNANIFETGILMIKAKGKYTYHTSDSGKSFKNGYILFNFEGEDAGGHSIYKEVKILIK